MIGQQLVRSWAAPAMRGVQRRGVSVISGENQNFLIRDFDSILICYILGPARTPVPFSVSFDECLKVTESKSNNSPENDLLMKIFCCVIFQHNPERAKSIF